MSDTIDLILTEDQRNALAPLLKQVDAAARTGKKGMIIGQFRAFTAQVGFVPYEYEGRIREIEQDELQRIGKAVLGIKKRSADKIIHLAIRGHTHVESAMRFYEYMERHPDTELAKMAKKNLAKLENFDKRNVSEIARIERALLREMKRGLDDRQGYLREIDRLEREVMPRSSRKKITKEIMISTEEAIRALEEEVMRESEDALKKDLKK